MNRRENLHLKKTLQIEGTNDSSCLSKYSCTCQGYFTDNYLKYFVQKEVRRSPLIHVGYCIRSSIINYVFNDFAQKIGRQNAQVVSVGAGFDTLFFRSSNWPQCENFTFYEIDLPRVVDKKINCILRSEKLKDTIGSYNVSESIFSSKKYFLISVDLRNLQVVDQLLTQCGIDVSLPTIFLSECAITYLEETSSTNLIKWASKFTNSTFVTYEQIHPNDGFGVVMLKHFEVVGSPLQSLCKYPTLADQEHRYTSNNWLCCRSISAYDAYTQVVACEEQWRVLLLEPFDEWEELHLKCNHYTLSIASRGCLTNWADLSFERPKYINGKRIPIEWNLVKLRNLDVYGHCTVSASTQGGEELLVIGGFGHKDKAAHARCKTLTCIKQTININNDIVFECKVVNESVNLYAMFATCCKVRSTASVASFIVYGGRTSPKHCVNTCPVRVDVRDGYTVQCESLVDCCRAQPRWRHAAVVAKQAGLDTLLVFGGRTSQLEVLKDLWKIVLHEEKERCKICSIDYVDGPCARFSHSATVKSVNPEYDEVYVSGGLDSNVRPVSDIWKLDLVKERWVRVATEGMLPRYGHTSHVVDNSLILVGGVNTLDEQQPGVGVVDLTTGRCVEYSLPMVNPEQPFMLINHSSVLSEDKTIIRTVGGGGNCFSFGTIFNNLSASIAVNQFHNSD